MALPLIGGLVALASSTIVKMLVDRVLFFLALKALITAFFIVVAPIVIKNVVYDLISLSMDMVNSASAGSSEFNGVVEFTGLAAWLIDKLMIPQVISLCVSALQLHLLLKMIPFSPVK